MSYRPNFHLRILLQRLGPSGESFSSLSRFVIRQSPCAEAALPWKGALVSERAKNINKSNVADFQKCILIIVNYLL
jgi:hypothetical protein